MTRPATIGSGILILMLGALCALAANGLSSRRPAYVNVRWAPAVDVFTQHEAERTHGLVPQREVVERTWEYYLADVSRPSIERIVRDPAVEDTHFINRNSFRINGNGKRGPYPVRWHARAVGTLNFMFRLSLLAGCLAVGFGASRTSHRVDREAGKQRAPIDVALLLILAGATASRLYLASTLDYIHDEENTAIPLAQSISFAPHTLNLPLRGENHGALPAYVVKASGALFGTSPLGYRMLHVVLGLCSILMVYGLARDAGGLVAARWAAGLLAFNEYFLAFSSRATANTPYLFLVTAAVFAFARFLANQQPLALYGAAIATGLAFYCKEHAILLLPAFALAFFVYHLDWLRRPHPYLAAMLFGLIVAPDLLWNVAADPETVHVSYGGSYVAQSTYAAHLRRVGGLGLSPYPAMFYAREPVTRLLRWTSGREVADVAGYPALNPVLGILLVMAVLATTFVKGSRDPRHWLLLAVAWGTFVFFTVIRKGDPPNRLSSVSWLWVESTLIPVVVIGGTWLSTLRGRWRTAVWSVAALALFYATDTLLWLPWAR